MTPEEQAAVDKAAADQRERDRLAAAQKAVVAQKATQLFHYSSGGPGKPFNIDGTGFGTGGSVTIGGQAVTPTKWTDTQIKGVAPLNLEPGPVEAVVNGKKITA